MVPAEHVRIVTRADQFLCQEDTKSAYRPGSNGMIDADRSVIEGVERARVVLECDRNARLVARKADPNRLFGLAAVAVTDTIRE